MQCNPECSGVAPFAAVPITNCLSAAGAEYLNIAIKNLPSKLDYIKLEIVLPRILYDACTYDVAYLLQANKLNWALISNL